MRQALVNANNDLVAENSKYVVRITGNDEFGKSQLDYFIDSHEKYPVIATTSMLMSTGVDSKTTKLIVLDKNIRSMTEFKQIIGRGTRLREDLLVNLLILHLMENLLLFWKIFLLNLLKFMPNHQLNHLKLFQELMEFQLQLF